MKKSDTPEHYLKQELYQEVSENPYIFEFLQRGSLDGLWYWDLENPEHEWMNEEFWRVLGYDPSERKHLAREWQDLIFPEDLAEAMKRVEKHLADPSEPYDQVVRYRHRDGHTVWVRCRGVAIRDETGKPIRMLGAHNDLTEQKQLEEELRRAAEEDYLTRLPNRRGFYKHAEWVWANHKRTGDSIAVILVDLDHFKRVNDSLGHTAGDKTLKVLSEKLKEACRETDFVCRWGGEEFLILCHNTDRVGAEILAHRVNHTVKIEDMPDGPVTSSVGVAVRSESDDFDLEELVRRADEALYWAKHHGRNRVKLHDELPKSGPTRGQDFESSVGVVTDRKAPGKDAGRLLHRGNEK